MQPMFLFIDAVTHEVEENVKATETGGELGSRRNCRRCRKNPSHKNFISANKFSPDCLDVWKGKSFDNKNGVKVAISNPLIFDMIRTDIALCVRLESEYVSKERPEANYPLSGRRGEWLASGRNVGSGKVWSVDKMCDSYACVSWGWGWNVEWYRLGLLGLLSACNRAEARCPECGGKGERGCRCTECMVNERREAKWWQIRIKTSRHVVYDTSEAQSCHVVLFDDGESQPLELTAGRGAVVRRASTGEDRCELVVYTHDNCLGQKLEECVRRRKEVIEKIDEIRESVEGEVIKPAYTIGHPHGRRCYVTLGEAVEGWGKAGLWSVKYRVDTCPGNSGGVGVGTWWWGVFTSIQRAHSGATDQSGVGTSADVF